MDIPVSLTGGVPEHYEIKRALRPVTGVLTGGWGGVVTQTNRLAGTNRRASDEVCGAWAEFLPVVVDRGLACSV